MTLIIFAAILTIVSLVISYFRTTWRKLVLIIGVAGAIVALVQGYRNQQRANDLQKQLSETRQVLPRTLTDEQVTEFLERVRPFAGQAFAIGTYGEFSECMSIAKRIHDTLQSGDWQFRRFHSIWRGTPQGTPHFMLDNLGFTELPPIPIVGISVNVESNAEEKTKKAAKALVDALHHVKVDAEIRSSYSSPETTTNIIRISVGTKRD